MAASSESASDRLWAEYEGVFQEFDDHTLARWLAQTLGQIEGHVWRASHPLMGAYRLAAQVGHDRQIWLKRLAILPAAYPIAECCRAPLLPLVTRDVVESGLICQHCGATAIPFDDIPEPQRQSLRQWASDYAPVHAVAHQEEDARQTTANADAEFERAAQSAEDLLCLLGRELMPPFLDWYPAAVWEDQDECLEVRPEDLLF
ncbi:MAG TPA: hypothetical protein P5555_17615 [Candidatus Paceibacterota bacterium]|nr:hypothetical protein [Verrucomicrobiota bacterium]HOX04097.1 hypothetical protein [Verrucomicrobiota bacterium]HRZ46998.1 hypothetical protein [Candidatus Paceibacterota bacterium]HRZ94520.1 hypothetical protein [Candidatus Paceibacterota bacterium]